MRKSRSERRWEVRASTARLSLEHATRMVTGFLCPSIKCDTRPRERAFDALGAIVDILFDLEVPEAQYVPSRGG